MRIPSDIPSYAALLDSCYAAGELSALRCTHARLILVGLSSHDFLRSKLCAAYARCDRLRESLYILSLAHRRPSFLYNSILRSHVATGNFLAAVSIVPLMLRHSVSPNSATISSSLAAAAAIPSIRLGHLLHAAALAAGLASDTAVSNALISMYSKSGDLTSARRIYDFMPPDRRNIVSRTAVISAYGAHGMAKKALHLFDEMLEGGHESPDGAALTAVLTACSHGRLVDEGKRVLDAARRLWRLNVKHYTCVVDMLGRVGRVEEAAELLTSVVEAGELNGEPDEALWGALLAACRAHGRLDVAENVARAIYAKMDSCLT